MASASQNVEDIVQAQMNEDPILTAKILNRMRSDFWDVEARERGSFPLMKLRNVLNHDRDVQLMLNDYVLFRTMLEVISDVTKSEFHVKSPNSPITFVLRVLENLAIKWAHEKLNELGYYIENEHVAEFHPHPTWKVQNKETGKKYHPCIDLRKCRSVLSAVIAAMNGRDRVFSFEKEEETQNKVFLPFESKVFTTENVTPFTEHLKGYAVKVFGSVIQNGDKDQVNMYSRDDMKRKRRYNQAMESYIMKEEHGVWPSQLRTGFTSLENEVDDDEIEELVGQGEVGYVHKRTGELLASSVPQSPTAIEFEENHFILPSTE